MICMKTAGREAGRYCVVVGKEEKGFVTVTGPRSLTGVRRRKTNTAHIEPTPFKIKIADGAQDAEVERAVSEDILKKLGIEKKTSNIHKAVAKEENKSAKK